MGTISGVVPTLAIMQNRQGVGESHPVVGDGACNELVSLGGGQPRTFFETPAASE